MTRARIVIIDDNPDLVDPTVKNIRALGANADAYLPDEVDADDLLRADLVLLDLEMTEWEPRDAPALQQPQDGLGFASVVRSHFRKRERSGAVALLSGRLPQLAGGLTPHTSEHGIARLHSLEWAFAKTRRSDLPLDLHERIVLLAEAGRLASETWSKKEEDPTDALERYLRLPGEALWTKRARVDLAVAQPPIHQLAAASGGLSVLRWLAQRILPYPTFLVDEAQTAVMLGVDPAAFRDALDAEDDIADRLSGGLYAGALADFLGRRWWAAAVQAFVADLSDGRPVAGPDTVERLQKLTTQPLTLLQGDAVVCIDPDLAPLESPVARHAVVRVRPDDWPPFARPAYAPISSFDNPDDDPRIAHFRALVDPADVPLLRD